MSEKLGDVVEVVLRALAFALAVTALGWMLGALWSWGIAPFLPPSAQLHLPCKFWVTIILIVVALGAVAGAARE